MGHLFKISYGTVKKMSTVVSEPTIVDQQISWMIKDHILEISRNFI